MAVNNSLTKTNNQRLGLTAYLTRDAVRDQINKVVGGKDGQRFISAIVSATTTNCALRADIFRNEFKNRSSIIVKTTNDFIVNFILNFC